MGNLKEMGLVKLSKDEAKLTDGGRILIFAHFREVLEAFNWAYQEFKKGVDDGYNNK